MVGPRDARPNLRAAEKLCTLLWKSGQKPGELCVDAGRGIADNPGGMLFYLAGSIEYSPDSGKSWRAQITPLLQALGHAVYDPAEDEKKNLTESEAREFRKWKTGDLARFQRTVRKIIAYDLDLIEQRCDAIVCYWDEHAGRGAGTQGELTFAHRLGIPVYLICGMRVDDVSGWLLGCATEVFTGFQDFLEFAKASLGSQLRQERANHLATAKPLAAETWHAASRREAGWKNSKGSRR